MKPQIIARVVSVLIFGALLACGVHLDHLKRGQMGREEFLAKQAARFDRHFAKSDPIVVELVAGVFTAGAAFGVYELMAFGISAIVRKISDGDRNS